MGIAHVGYLPNGKIAGLSKLARVVDEISRRPQVQERMTHQIADLLNKELDAKGVGEEFENAVYESGDADNYLADLVYQQRC